LGIAPLTGMKHDNHNGQSHPHQKNMSGEIIANFRRGPIYRAHLLKQSIWWVIAAFVWGYTATFVFHLGSGNGGAR